MTYLGVYRGNDVPGAYNAFETWMGREIDSALAFGDQRDWTAFRNNISWLANLFKQLDCAKVFSIPLIVEGANLTAGAAGNYDAHWTYAANALASAYPTGIIFVRTAWEFNGNWMPWAAQGQYANFKACFQRFVGRFRAVSNRFRFEWCTNIAQDNPELSYPGDAYVDIIGMDFYHWTGWGDPADPTAAFNYMKARSWGLDWLNGFATAHSKPIALTEWGVRHDNFGPYVQAVADWINAHNVIYHHYWDSDSAYPGRLSDGGNAATGAAFITAFGGTPSGAPGDPGSGGSGSGSEPPAPVYVSGLNIREDTPVSTVLYQISGLDPENDPLTFSEVADPDNKFTVSGAQLILSAALNYEVKTTHSLTLRATDPSGNTYDETFVFNVVDVEGSGGEEPVNTAPTDIQMSTLVLPEATPVGTVVATITGTDPEDDTLTFTKVLDYGDTFNLVGNQLILAVPLDYATWDIHTVRIRATDPGGLWYEETFIFDVLPAGTSNPGTWTPEEFASSKLAVWLDASDADTVIRDGSNVVSEWQDKSGNNRHSTPSGGSVITYLPTGMYEGKAGLQCAATGARRMRGNLAPGAKQKYTFFAVWQQAVDGGGRVLSVGTNGFSDTAGDILQRTAIAAIFDASGSGIGSYHNDLLSRDIQAFGLTGEPPGFTAPVVSSSTLDYGGGGDRKLYMRCNGFKTTTNTSTSGLGNQSMGPEYALFAGMLNDTPGGEQVTIAEILILLDATEEEEEMVEGYLCHRYETVGWMNTTHPYYMRGPDV